MCTSEADPGELDGAPRIPEVIGDLQMNEHDTYIQISGFCIILVA